MSRTRIFALAGDAGGANALKPVIAELIRADVDVQLAGYAVATGLWRAAGHEVLDLPVDTTPEQAEALLRKMGAGLLLTGTSVNAHNMEQRFTLAARGAGIPSVALLDFWSNYAPRFSSAEAQLDRLPDRIAIMDAQARDEMLAAGIPANRLVITGQPLFDDMQELRETFQASRRLELRQLLGVEGNDRLVVFVGQPLNDVHGAQGAKAVLGYDELEVLPLVAETVERLARDIPLRLVFLPHPREGRDKYAPQLSGRPWASLGPAGADSRELVLAADLAVGMSSMLLMESVLLGTPALSVQPNLRRPDALPVSRNGVIPRVERPGELDGALRCLLLDPAARAAQRLDLPKNAASAVAQLVLQMLQQGPD